MHRKTTLKTLDWVEAWYRLFDVLYQNGIRDALCAAYRPILTAVWDIWLHLTPEERKSPRMKEAFAYERTARPSADASPRRNTEKFVGGSGLHCIGLQLSGSMPQKGGKTAENDLKQ